jgi:hypothetical protein
MRTRFAVAACLFGLVLTHAASAHPLVFGDVDGGTMPQTPEAVRARFDRINATLKEDDGIARFNQLFVVTTRNLERAWNRGVFEEPAFMKRFSVRFANLYFVAVSEHSADRWGAPSSWKALFDKRMRSDEIKPVQFALAGMHAHVLHDLPLALESAFADEPEFPREGSLRHRDYMRVNDVMSATFEEARDVLVPDEDSLAGLATDLTGVPWIVALRARAWENARKLSGMAEHPIRHGLFIEALDAATAAGTKAIFLLKL